MTYEHYEDNYWENWNGEICAGCDLPSQVNDLGLCDTCYAKLERDMIRSRDWDRSGLAFGTPDSELENLRLRIIREHGKDYELTCITIGESFRKLHSSCVVISLTSTSSRLVTRVYVVWCRHILRPSKRAGIILRRSVMQRFLSA